MESCLSYFDESGSLHRRRSTESSARVTRRISMEAEELNDPSDTKSPTPELTTYGGIKLGWIQGVLIPCLLNIWGVTLFLRIAWIVAQAGVGLTLIIIAMSCAVCVITTLSLSAICTNGQLSGGGVYYVVSRSLGAELGASVGIIFAFANAVAASMNTIGFCESLNELLKSHNVKIIDNSVNDIRIVGTIALILMCVICAIGMDWETKTQNVLIVTILLAIANYIVGSLIGPRSDSEIAKGFVGINKDTLSTNWYPDYRTSDSSYNNFVTIFAIYFPAVTGVQAGANICGDLRDPASAIPKGTLMAVAISTTSYVALTLVCGSGALRDASGITADLSHNVLAACKPNCTHGLHNNYEVMQLMSAWGPFIYVGCWAATLSTALTNLLSVPRLIQALGIDRIYPGLIFFSKPYGKHGEPYRGYVLTFLVSLLFLLIANLDTIAPLITNFYLASYALINFCTFHASILTPLSWRPTFKYYTSWLSLLGFCACFIIMMVISWAMTLLTLAIFFTLYLVVLYRQPDTNWGSSTDWQRYRQTVSDLIQMSHRAQSVKGYNPQLLVLAGRPYHRPALLYIGHQLTKNGSFMIAADINVAPLTHWEHKLRVRTGEYWMKTLHNRGFYVAIDNVDLLSGAQSLIQASGLGNLSPNILLLGYKNIWNKVPPDELVKYVTIINKAFENDLGVAIFRPPLGTREIKRRIRTPRVPSLHNVSDMLKPDQHYLTQVMNTNSDIELLDNDTSEITEEKIVELQDSDSHRHKSTAMSYVEFMLHENNVVDAWWLYDDGGLNILLPFIITQRSNKRLLLRIFALAQQQFSEEEATINMKDILTKYRIEYDKLTVINLDSEPQPATWDMFNDIITKYNNTAGESGAITAHDLTALHDKTSRHLRLRELLLEHSSDADLIVQTLPRPKISAALYMSWLEALSAGLPQTLFVRGNDQHILTTYA